MKKIVLLILISYSVSLNAQNILDSLGRKQGCWEEIVDARNRVEAYYSDGLLDGERRLFVDDYLMEIRYYRDGVISGPYIRFYRNCHVRTIMYGFSSNVTPEHEDKQYLCYRIDYDYWGIVQSKGLWSFENDDVLGGEYCYDNNVAQRYEDKKSENRTDLHGRRQGSWVEEYDHPLLKQRWETNYLDDRYDGEMRHFIDGRISQLYYYREGALAGSYILWWGCPFNPDPIIGAISFDFQGHDGQIPYIVPEAIGKRNKCMEIEYDDWGSPKASGFYGFLDDDIHEGFDMGERKFYEFGEVIKIETQ